MRIYILLMLLLVWGCVPFIVVGRGGVGGRVINEDTLWERIDRDFPDLFHTAIYVLHKKGYTDLMTDRTSKTITAKKDTLLVSIAFFNPVPSTTEVKVKVLKDGMPDLEEASSIMSAIFREEYHPSSFLEH